MFCVIYLCNSTIIQKRSGYTVRTHELLKSLIKKKKDIQIMCLSKPESNISKINISYLDGIKYYNFPINKDVNKMNGTLYTKEYIQTYLYYVNKIVSTLGDKPSVIHSASNYINPFIANTIGKRYNIPTIYEVRGLWHLSRLSYDKNWENTAEYKKYIEYERSALEKSTHILTLNSKIKNYIVKNYGIKGDKITISPNGVDTNKFVLQERKDPQLQTLYNPSNFVSFGYVGSLVNYEGLDLFVKAVNRLNREGLKFVAIIVGKGSTNVCNKIFQQLERYKNSHNLDNLFITGEVPYYDVCKYYSIIDVICLPRKGYEVCEIVTPLKPFEGLAMGKPLILSSVGGLENIINDDCGCIFDKNDNHDLALSMKQFITNPDIIPIIGKKSRELAEKKYAWNNVNENVIKLYKKIQQK